MSTILILDDDPASRNVMRWVVEAYGLTAVEVEDPNDAIRLCEASDVVVDLLLADVRLRSTLSGTHVALRVHKSRPDLPILFTSGTPPDAWWEHDKINLRELNSARTDFIQKPFTAMTMVSAIRALLDGAIRDSDPPPARQHRSHPVCGSIS